MTWATRNLLLGVEIDSSMDWPIAVASADNMKMRPVRSGEEQAVALSGGNSNT
jgi:hypothetical protein